MLATPIFNRKFIFVFIFLFWVDISDGLKKINKPKLTKAGEKQYARANYDAALKLFQESIAMGDSTGTSRFFIGLILEAKRKYSESIRYYIQAVEYPLEKQYKKAALWKIVLYCRQTGDYARLLEYSDILKKLIGPNQKLNDMIANAELNISPIHIEARKMLKQASELEIGFSPHRKEKSFWEDQAEAIGSVAGIYESIARMDERYQHFAWKSASYYENLKQWDDAIRIYRWITNMKLNQKADYKIGVILRKQEKYSDAKEYLTKVIESEEAKKILKYYAHINIIQSYYALQNFVKAEKYAKSALKSEFRKFRKKRQENMIRLIKCNASLQVNNIIKYSQEKKILSGFKKDFKHCYDFIKKENFFQKSKDYENITLVNLIRAKWLYYVSILNEKYHTKYNSLAFQYYSDAFLIQFQEDQPKENQKEPENDHLEHEGITIYAPEPKDRPKKPQSGRQGWCLAELSEITNLIFNQKQYTILRKLLLNYQHKLQIHPDYQIWLADSSFFTEDYHQACKAYLTLSNRSLEHEKRLLLSFASLERWEDFKSEIKNYIYSFTNMKEKLIWFLNSDVQFQPLRTEKTFLHLLEEIQAIDQAQSQE